MQQLNPKAVAFWGFLAGIGGLASGWHGALVGLTIGLGVSVFVAGWGE